MNFLDFFHVSGFVAAGDFDPVVFLAYQDVVFVGFYQKFFAGFVDVFGLLVGDLVFPVFDQTEGGLWRDVQEEDLVRDGETSFFVFEIVFPVQKRLFFFDGPQL